MKVVYPGGTPEDIEQLIVTRIEEAIYDLPGITEMRSTANEGSGSVTMEVADGFEYREVVNDIQTRVDLIHSFPDELEDLEVGIMARRFEVITVAVSGDLPETELRELGQRVRDEIAAIDDITQVDISGIRPFEISIEVSEKSLREYGLTFSDIVNSIRRSSIDLPAGSIQTGDHEFLVRTTGQAYTAAEFGNIIVKTAVDETHLRIGDIVIPVLLLSLVETKLILPAHLKHMRMEDHFPWLKRIQQRMTTGLEWFIDSLYQPLLSRALRRPGLTLAIFFSILIILANTLLSVETRGQF